MTLIGRHYPHVSCEVVFSKEEWKTIYMSVKKEKPPKRPPILYDLVRMVAVLGGFLNRKQDGEPGPAAIWLGLQKTKDFILAHQVFSSIREKTYG